MLLIIEEEKKVSIFKLGGNHYCMRHGGLNGSLVGWASNRSQQTTSQAQSLLSVNNSA